MRKIEIWNKPGFCLRETQEVKMKTLTLIIFCCMLGVFVAGSVSAHDAEYEKGTPIEFFQPHSDPSLPISKIDVTAAETDPNDESAVNLFTTHVTLHLGRATIDTSVLVEFRRSLREEGSTFNSGDEKNMYAIFASYPEGEIIIHGKYHNENVDGKSVRGLKDAKGEPVMDTLFSEAREAAEARIIWEMNPTPVPADPVACVPYHLSEDDAMPRYACAWIVSEVPGRLGSFIMIGGFDHDLEDLPVDVPEEFLQYNSRLSVTAADVAEKNDSETLKNFVREAASIWGSILLASDGIGIDAVLNLRIPMTREPWKSGPIYLFVMTEKGLVVFNANNRELEDTTLNVVDKTGLNIGEAIIKLVEEEEEGFIDYYWDNPDVDGDETRDEDGKLVPGKSPGTSLKRSYVKAVDVGDFSQGEKWIIGSGIYPKDESGCALASGWGGGNTLRNAMFSLLLIVSVLVSAVLWKSRSNPKRT